MLLLIQEMMFFFQSGSVVDWGVQIYLLANPDMAKEKDWKPSTIYTTWPDWKKAGCSTADWIMETPSYGWYSDLANYGSVTMTGAFAYRDKSWNPIPYQDRNSRILQATLTQHSFKVLST